MNFRIIICFLMGIHVSFSQVGIGTTAPRPGSSLDIRGSLLVQNQLRLNNFSDGISSLEDNYKIITRLLNTEPKGQVARLEVAKMDVAPVNIINYSFTNVNKDNISDVDLGYDSDKYIVVISNFSYEGGFIEKRYRRTGSGWFFDPYVYHYIYQGNFVRRTFVKDGSWHLEIRNRDLDAPDPVPYRLTLVVYDKKYFRQLPVITGNLRGNNNGAVNAPLGL